MATPIETWAIWESVLPPEVGDNEPIVPVPPARNRSIVSLTQLQKSIENFRKLRTCKRVLYGGYALLAICDIVYVLVLCAAFWTLKPDDWNLFWYICAASIDLFVRSMMLLQRTRNIRWTVQSTETSLQKSVNSERVLGPLGFFLGVIEAALLGVAVFLHCGSGFRGIQAAAAVGIWEIVYVIGVTCHKQFALCPLLKKLSAPKPQASNERV